MSDHKSRINKAAKNSFSGASKPKTVDPDVAPSVAPPPTKSVVKKIPSAKLVSKSTAVPSKTPPAGPGGPTQNIKAPPPFLRRRVDTMDESETSQKSTSTITTKPLNNRDFPKGVISGVRMKIATTEQIIGHNRCQVSEPVVSAATNAVCDPRMGAMHGINCESCGRGVQECQGHPGYIKLKWPIINPVYIKSVLGILRLFCFKHFLDYKVRLDKETVLLKVELKRTNDGRKPDGSQYTLAEVEKLAEERMLAGPDPPEKIVPCFDPEAPERDYAKSYGSWRLRLINHYRNCKKCVGDIQPVTYSIKRDFYIEERIGNANEGESSVVDPTTILKFFQAIDEDPRGWSRILGFGDNKLAAMINEVWPVMGNPLRLDTKTDNETLQNPLSKLYADATKYNNILGGMINDFETKTKMASADMGPTLQTGGGLTFIKMLTLTMDAKAPNSKTEKTVTGAEVYNSLNTAIKAIVYDKDDPENDNGQRRAGKVQSITLIVNGKHGIMRKSAMGKGRDQTARTVIRGDDDIDIDEVGISRYFADHLTIPEILETEADVAKWTQEMPKVVGDKKVMGSIVRVHQRGRREAVDVTVDKDIRLKVGDTVRRRMVNGDVVVISRQPVLHKGGLMGFRIRIFEEGGNVMRLHPAVAGPFNADFDGDEMNFNVPQSPAARADVLKHMMIGNCIRGDKYSTPWVGMIQNPVVAASQITQPGVVIEKELAKRLIDIGLETFRRRNPGGIFRTDTKEYYDALYSLDLGINPSSGHALVSFFLPKTLKYVRRNKKDEPLIVIERGFMLKGVLAKADIGKASNGLVDTILTTYGSEAVIVFISALNRALYEFLSSDGFSIGIRDCVLPNLPDGTNPQDTIDALVLDTTAQVVDLLERGKKAGPLGFQAEAKADALLAELSDRINEIVIAGGVDVVMLRSKIMAEKNDVGFLEMLKLSLTLPVKLSLDNPSTANLIEAEILEDTPESLRDLVTKMITTIERGARKGDQNGQYNREMHLLRIVADLFIQAPRIDHHFEDLYLASLDPNSLNTVISERLLEAASYRSDIIGASKFNNRLLTAIYTGARGTKSNLLSSLGLVGIQEKGFVGKDETYKRTTPYHEEGSLDPVSTHFCGSSFAKGLDPYEFWTHASASRANIITTNLKPSETGWFYRRSVCVFSDHYGLVDGTVRDERGRIAQFMYGGDGCEATKLVNVSPDLPPQFVDVESVAKNLRTKEGLIEYEIK
jgi:DNA-directed RNA polymerase beta' subunit